MGASDINECGLQGEVRFVEALALAGVVGFRFEQALPLVTHLPGEARGVFQGLVQALGGAVLKQRPADVFEQTRVVAAAINRLGAVFEFSLLILLVHRDSSQNANDLALLLAVRIGLQVPFEHTEDIGRAASRLAQLFLKLLLGVGLRGLRRGRLGRTGLWRRNLG